VKITVTSHPDKYEVNKDLKPLYSEDIKIYNEDKLSLHLKGMPENMPAIVYNTIFYGRGRGIHSTQPFNGIILRDILLKYFPVNKENLQNAYFVFVAKDGYRCVYSFSEIMNRANQAELLLIPDIDNKDDGGAFRIFPAADFFSDRAVKAVSEIKLIKI
jgi:hypothetical protein